MKVLLLSPFFYPEEISTGKYNTALAQALLDAGADVQVIASHPLYPSWRPTFSRATLKSIAVIRGGAWMRYPRAMLLRRFAFEIWYLCHATWTIWSRQLKPDVVLAVFPPTLFFALAPILFSSRTRRVGIVHDFQSRLGFLQDESLVSRFLRQGVRSIDRASFHFCDTLVVLSKAMARIAAEEYNVPPDRILVAYPFVTVQSPDGQPTELAAVLPDGVQHVVYAGALGKKQNPDALFNFFTVAAARFPEVQFHIFSAGPIFEDLRKRNSTGPIGRLHLHPLVAEACLRELYSRSTVQVIPQAEGSAEACLPSKLPNIIASGCLALAICDGQSELAEIVGQYCGTSVSTWRPDLLLIALESLLARARFQSAEDRRRGAANLISTCFNINGVVRAVFGEPCPEERGCVPTQTVGVTLRAD